MSLLRVMCRVNVLEGQVLINKFKIMAFDRGKFKGASVETNKELVKKVNEITKFDGGGRVGFHNIDEGINIFRICPPHDLGDPSMQPKCTTWLPIEVDEVDKDKKPTGKKVLANRPLFNSKVHYNTPKDLVEEYIDFVYKLVYDAVQDKDERQKQLYPISGWRGKDGKWNSGIRPSTAYVMYAFKDSKLARVEITKTDRDSVDKLNITEAADEPIITDIFSDPDEGLSLIINHRKNDKGKWENIFSKREFNPKKFKTWADFIASEKMTDEQLEEFSKQTSLKELYCMSFKRSDFKKQLEGLQNFDEKNKYNVFQHDDFLAIVEEIDKYYPEEDPAKDDSDIKEVFKQQTPIEEMTRKELKDFITTKELGIVVKSQMSDDDIRELINEVLSEQASEEKPKEEIKKESKPQEKKVEKEVHPELNKGGKEYNDLPFDKEVKAANVSPATSDKLAAMRERLKAGKK